MAISEGCWATSNSFLKSKQQYYFWPCAYLNLPLNIRLLAKFINHLQTPKTAFWHSHITHFCNKVLIKNTKNEGDLYCSLIPSFSFSQFL